MDKRFNSAFSQVSSIQTNAHGVNKASKERAQFADAANVLAQTTTHQSQLIKAQTESSHDSLIETRTAVAGILNLATAVDFGTSTTLDLENAINGFTKNFNQINNYTDAIATTAQNINLISLIARVEAARVASNGSTFDSVSEEIKSLADNTANHAKRIRKSVRSLQSAAATMSERTVKLRSIMLMNSSHSKEARGKLNKISTILDKALHDADKTHDEADAQISSVSVINEHLGTLAKGVKSLIQGSSENASISTEILGKLEVLDDTWTLDGSGYNSHLNDAGLLAEKILHNAKNVNHASISRANIAHDTVALAEDAQSTAVQGTERLIETDKILSDAKKMLSESVNSLVIGDDVKTMSMESIELANQFHIGFTEIETLSKQVNRISFETKILALNSTVEASRAGINGKGFGVVANEVSALAESVGECATEIISSVSALSTLSNEVKLATENLDDAIDKLVVEGDRVEIENVQLGVILSKTMQEISEVEISLTKQAEYLAEISRMSQALESDARSAISGSAKNMDLCGSLINSLNQLHHPTNHRAGVQ